MAGKPKRQTQKTTFVEIPKELEGRLEGCMCGKNGKRKAYLTLDSFQGEVVRGIAETHCPYCIRMMDFEYFIDFQGRDYADFAGRKPVVKLKERRPYGDDRVVKFIFTR